MLCLRSWIDKDIIYENNDELVQILGKDLVHQVHECCGCVRQSKGHDDELIQSSFGIEDGLKNVLLSNAQLKLACPAINLGEETSSSKLIKEVVNPQHGVLVLHCHHIQLAVINAKPKGTILFGKQYMCCQGNILLRMNSACLTQLSEPASPVTLSKPYGT